MSLAQIIITTFVLLALVAVWFGPAILAHLKARRELRRHNRTQRADRALKKQEAREFDEWSERALEREQRRMEREARREAA